MFGVQYGMVAKPMMPAQNNQDSVRLSPLPTPSKTSSYCLSLRGPRYAATGVHLLSDGVRLALRRISQSSSPEGEVSLSCLLLCLELFLALSNHNVLQHTASQY